MGTWASSDSRPLTPALVSDLLQGNVYFDIQTQEFPTGEIRARLAPTPEPSILCLSLLCAAGLGLAGLKRRRANPAGRPAP
jgi:hypothetical protein